VLIALIGLPGSGKSTVGQLLAHQLKLDFIDSDAVIETRLCEPIRSYFEQHGEFAFRDIEEQVIQELTHYKAGVLATGGGAVIRGTNRQRLRQCSKVIYLQCSAELLYSRLKNDTQRPLLQVEDPLLRLRELYKQRDPLYRQTAHFTINAGRISAHVLANKIGMQLELG
jgi:shikimate kinase